MNTIFLRTVSLLAYPSITSTSQKSIKIARFPLSCGGHVSCQVVIENPSFIHIHPSTKQKARKQSKLIYKLGSLSFEKKRNHSKSYSILNTNIPQLWNTVRLSSPCRVTQTASVSVPLKPLFPVSLIVVLCFCCCNICFKHSTGKSNKK